MVVVVVHKIRVLFNRFPWYQIIIIIIIIVFLLPGKLQAQKIVDQLAIISTNFKFSF